MTSLIWHNPITGYGPMTSGTAGILIHGFTVSLRLNSDRIRVSIEDHPGLPLDLQELDLEFRGTAMETAARLVRDMIEGAVQRDDEDEDDDNAPMIVETSCEICHGLITRIVGLDPESLTDRPVCDDCWRDE